MHWFKWRVCCAVRHIWHFSAFIGRSFQKDWSVYCGSFFVWTETLLLLDDSLLLKYGKRLSLTILPTFCFVFVWHAQGFHKSCRGTCQFRNTINSSWLPWRKICSFSSRHGSRDMFYMIHLTVRYHEGMFLLHKEVNHIAWLTAGISWFRTHATIYIFSARVLFPPPNKIMTACPHKKSPAVPYAAKVSRLMRAQSKLCLTANITGNSVLFVRREKDSDWVLSPQMANNDQTFSQERDHKALSQKNVSGNILRGLLK